MKTEKAKGKKGIIDSVGFSMIGMNDGLVCSGEVLGKELLDYNAFHDKKLAKSYWKLDGNAFDDQPAPIFMKLDALIIGGLPVVMMLPQEETDQGLVKELDAEDLGHVPIAFMDMHKTGERDFVVSGLGVAKPYQGMGLSKYMIYAGVKVSGANTLVIPTQLSNKKAHYAWHHLGPLEVLSSDVFHNEPDTIVYKAKISDPKDKILGPLVQVTIGYLD